MIHLDVNYETNIHLIIGTDAIGVNWKIKMRKIIFNIRTKTKKKIWQVKVLELVFSLKKKILIRCANDCSRIYKLSIFDSIYNEHNWILFYNLLWLQSLDEIQFINYCNQLNAIEWLEKTKKFITIRLSGSKISKCLLFRTCLNLN